MRVLEVMQAAHPVMPVMVIEDLDTAVPLARALVAGGIRTLEITLRTPVALAAVERIAKEVEGAIVGVGTAINAHQLQQAKAAGALFAVSPGFSAELGQAAKDLGIGLLPGVATSSDIIAALALGYSELKFFPAEQAGGVAMLKAFGGPFPQVTFCPTGGINPAKAKEYLALPNVACVGGSWLAPKDRVQAGDWAAITAIAAEAQALKTR